MNLIEARCVAADYPSQGRVFSGVSLDVRAGENMSILGPSGSGKSTLLKVLAGIKKPSAGAVRCAEVNGRPLRAGLMFQQPMLLPWLTVEANVALGERYHDRRDARTNPASLIASVGLSGFSRRKPSELSGGQRQRAAFARTLAHRPDVLLLDEPFSALDVELRKSLRQLVMCLAGEQRIPIVLVTHHPEEAAAFGGRILNMADLASGSESSFAGDRPALHGETANV